MCQQGCGSPGRERNCVSESRTRTRRPRPRRMHQVKAVRGVKTHQKLHAHRVLCAITKVLPARAQLREALISRRTFKTCAVAMPVRL